MTQKLIAQLGDVSPIEYGGYFIYEDENGAAEAEFLIAPSEPEDKGKWFAYRFALDRCTLINGVLSDNRFHSDKPEWFASRLEDVARFVGMELSEMQRLLISDSPVERAHGYEAIGSYHGFENLDSYPLTLTEDEARKRYAA
jgi:hypothetical protein